MRIRLLGPFEVLWGGSVATPTAPKLRRVLALLAINGNKLIRTDQLIEELWDDRPPISATTTLQTYIYQLRKLHHLTGDGTAGRPSLHTSPNGYVLSLPAGTLDVEEFTHLAERGRAEFDLGDMEACSATLHEALDLWRGPALADVGVGPVLHASVVWFEELRKCAMEQRIEADLRLGRHHELIGELTGVVAEQPTHEGFHGKLMLALYRCGRRSEALRVYQHAREALSEELGLEPSPELRRLHQAVLAADTSLDVPVSSRETVLAGGFSAPPSQLPPELPQFIGREEELAAVSDALTEADGAGPTVVVACGPPGSGKSAFCVRAANQAKSFCPDGQLYAELASADGTAVDPSSVLAEFLRAIGVPSSRIPDSVAERSRVFRSWTADRKVLIVLDDAVSISQLAPLLPTGPGCVTMVASRRRLAHPMIGTTIPLKPFGRANGVRLLNEALGRCRVAADQDAAYELVELCDGIPLALRTAVNQLQLRPHWSISRQVCRMREVERAERDAEMHASVWRTYQLMPASAQAAFRVFAPVRQPMSVQQASSILGTDEISAESLLEDLVQFQLAEVDATNVSELGGFRYRFRRPVGGVARSILQAKDSAGTPRIHETYAMSSAASA